MHKKKLYLHKKKLSLLLSLFFIALAFILGISFNKLPTILGHTNEVIEHYGGIANLVTLALSSVSFISVLVLIFQIRSEHEKSRREKACELLLEWTEQRKEKMIYARNIVEKFSIEQYRNLYLENKLEIDVSLKKDVQLFFNNDKINKNIRNNKIKLNKAKVRKLKHFVLLYLNLSESILAAWQCSIADKEIIENEFEFLCSPEEGQNVLQNYRTACGSENRFPAIELFCMRIKDKRKEKLKEKGNIA